jgi:hypothetical protein
MYRAGMKERISDLVPCHLVPGRALEEYAAVVGTEAGNYVKAFLTKSKRRDSVVIGLVVGNWMMLEQFPGVPVALARGEGHPEFKRLVISVSDEIYFITPLCKVVLGDLNKTTDEIIKDFNESLHKLGEEGGARRKYEGVQLPKEKRAAAKVVTSMRQNRNSIVVLHSQLVIDRLGKPPDDYANFALKPVNEIPNLVFAHDEASQKDYSTQLRIELPHKDTRTKWFRERYFHTSSEPAETTSLRK